MGMLLRNSPDLWMVLLRFEWHNPVSWKLKLPPPRALEPKSIMVSGRTPKIGFTSLENDFVNGSIYLEFCDESCLVPS